MADVANDQAKEMKTEPIRNKKLGKLDTFLQRCYMVAALVFLRLLGTVALAGFCTTSHY